MNFKELASDDFGIIQPIISGKYENSESSLASMYIWQHYYNSKFCIKNDVLYTIYKMPDKSFEAFMPYGTNRNSDEVIDELAFYFRKEIGANLVINLATEDFLNFIRFSGKYKIKYKEIPNSFDYVYNVNDLINLSGRKYHSKKNHFNSFGKKYDYEYKTYHQSMRDECIEFCSNVVKQRTQGDTATYESEMKSIIKAFDSYDALNLVSASIIVDNKIVALSVGERLTNDYALIHIEKAAYEYRDAYPVINRLMLQNEFSDMKYVNREEDLGIAGLRKAKQSYFPCKMIKKYRIEFLD